MEFKLTEPNETFHFEPFYKFLNEKSGGVSYEKTGDEIERDLDIADITPTDLLDEKIGPIFIKEYREQVTKRMKDDQYMRI